MGQVVCVFRDAACRPIDSWDDRISPLVSRYSNHHRENTLVIVLLFSVSPRVCPCLKGKHDEKGIAFFVFDVTGHENPLIKPPRRLRLNAGPNERGGKWKKTLSGVICCTRILKNWNLRDGALGPKHKTWNNRTTREAIQEITRNIHNITNTTSM